MGPEFAISLKIITFVAQNLRLMAKFNVYHDMIDLSELRELCLRHGVVREYAKGEKFLSEGTVPQEFALIEEGYFKFIVHSTDGEECVVGMSFDNDYLSDINSTLMMCPTEISIVAGRNCRIRVISMERFIDFASAKGLRFCVGFEAVLFRTVMGRYLDMYRLTPRERYLKLLTAYPDIFRKALLRDIASWLCITPVHLSRLRKSLLGK